MELEPLEAAVLRMLLEGEHPILGALRNQLLGLRVESRKLTGVGFFADLSTAETVRPAPCSRITLSDVDGSMAGVEHGIGFVLIRRRWPDQHAQGIHL